MKRPCLLALLFVLVSIPALAQSQLNVLSNLHPRPQQSYLRAGASFTLAQTTPIVIGNGSSSRVRRSAQYLNELLLPLLNDTLRIISAAEYTSAPFKDLPAILMGEAEPSDFPQLTSEVLRAALPTSFVTFAEAYLLDVTTDRLVLYAPDTAGLIHSIPTLLQLVQRSGQVLSVPPLQIIDYPDYPVRWAFLQMNQQVTANVPIIRAIEDTMAFYKMNGILSSDFKYNRLGEVPSWYFTNVDSIQRQAAARNIEITPGVCDIGYSEGILLHDPNLAEGIPTTSTYVIENGAGRLLTDPRVSIPNGGFEDYPNNQFSGWSFYDGPGVSAVQDVTRKHSGNASALCSNFVQGNAGGNCRFMRAVQCDSFRSYHMSVWIYTEGFAGTFQLLAIGNNGKGGSQVLTATQYSVAANSGGWTKYEVVFNTLTWKQMWLYAGVWGGTAGKIWLDDFAIEDAGLTNILRRPSTTPTVTVLHKSGTFTEGVDYSPLRDVVMENAYGTYPWHDSPALTIPSGSKIRQGDTVEVHLTRANPVLNYANGDGQSMVCLSEDTLYSILTDQITRVRDLLHPKRYFMGHDEIRLMNWDASCTERKMTPAQILGDNVTKCDALIKRISPDPATETFIWSDMFDSTHNAHNNYYLVNGDLSGDWNLIPKNVTIANWSPAKQESLEFFAKHGFSQVTCPYYDEKSTRSIHDWRAAMNGVGNVRGMIYTTWSADYTFLRPFADYVWHGGPMIVHTPIDSASVAQRTDGMITVEADIYGDRYDASDTVSSAWVVLGTDLGGGTGTVATAELQHVGGSHYTVTLQLEKQYSHTYWIGATSVSRDTSLSLIRSIPIIPSGTNSVASERSASISIYPNPASHDIRLTLPPGSYHATIVNTSGATAMTALCRSTDGEARIDVSKLPSGTYTLALSELQERLTFTIVR